MKPRELTRVLCSLANLPPSNLSESPSVYFIYNIQGFQLYLAGIGETMSASIIVPPYLWRICSKTPRDCLKLQIGLNLIYATFFLYIQILYIFSLSNLNCQHQYSYTLGPLLHKKLGLLEHKHCDTVIVC